MGKIRRMLKKISKGKDKKNVKKLSNGKFKKNLKKNYWKDKKYWEIIFTFTFLVKSVSKFVLYIYPQACCSVDM